MRSTFENRLEIYHFKILHRNLLYADYQIDLREAKLRSVIRSLNMMNKNEKSFDSDDFLLYFVSSEYHVITENLLYYPVPV